MKINRDEVIKLGQIARIALRGNECKKIDRPRCKSQRVANLNQYRQSSSRIFTGVP